MDGVMLASDWEGQDPTGYWLSEKLDGVRVVLTEKGLFTRSGRQISTPSWFPKVSGLELDGELWAGRNQFGRAISVASRSRCRPHDWSGVTFQVFDSPGAGTFEERLYRAAQFIVEESKRWTDGLVPRSAGIPPHSPLAIVWHERCRSKGHMQEFHDRAVRGGGEGVMLRRSGSKYHNDRSTDLLKVKLFKDAEAEVLGYTESDKRDREYRSLHCRLISDPSIEFDVGSGINQELLRKPPPVGSIITFKYQNFHPTSGKPRHPVFVRERPYHI